MKIDIVIIAFLFQQRATVSFSEGAIVGTRRLLEPASLPGSSALANYTIVQGDEDNVFRLHETRSQDGQGVAYVHIETRKKLDREATARYELNITEDGNNNGFGGYLALTVEVSANCINT